MLHKLNKCMTFYIFLQGGHCMTPTQTMHVFKGDNATNLPATFVSTLIPPKWVYYGNDSCASPIVVPFLLAPYRKLGTRRSMDILFANPLPGSGSMAGEGRVIWIDIRFLVYVDDNCFIVLVKKPVYHRFLEDVEVRRDVGSKKQIFSPCKQTNDFQCQKKHVKTGLFGSMISFFLTLRGMNKRKHNVYIYIWVFPKFLVPPNHPF